MYVKAKFAQDRIEPGEPNSHDVNRATFSDRRVQLILASDDPEHHITAVLRKRARREHDVSIGNRGLGKAKLCTKDGEKVTYYSSRHTRRSSSLGALRCAEHIVKVRLAMICSLLLFLKRSETGRSVSRRLGSLMTSLKLTE